MGGALRLGTITDSLGWTCLLVPICASSDSDLGTGMAEMVLAVNARHSRVEIEYWKCIVTEMKELKEPKELKGTKEAN